MENIELLAAQTLLEKGASLPVKAPFFLRLLGFRKLKIYQPSAGNYLRINSLYLKMDIQEQQLKQTSLCQAKKLEIKHTYTHCRMLVFALFKGYLTPLLLNRIMGKWLLWNLNQKQIMDITEILLVLGGTANFMNTTRLIREMRLTAPTGPSLGQQTRRS